MRKLLAVVAIGICGGVLSAQSLSSTPSGKFQLTVDNIMRGPALVG